MNEKDEIVYGKDIYLNRTRNKLESLRLQIRSTIKKRILDNQFKNECFILPTASIKITEETSEYEINQLLEQFTNKIYASHIGGINKGFYNKNNKEMLEEFINKGLIEKPMNEEDYKNILRSFQINNYMDEFHLKYRIKAFHKVLEVVGRLRYIEDEKTIKSFYEDAKKFGEEERAKFRKAYKIKDPFADLIESKIKSDKEELEEVKEAMAEDALLKEESLYKEALQQIIALGIEVDSPARPQEEFAKKFNCEEIKPDNQTGEFDFSDWPAMEGPYWEKATKRSGR